MDIVAIILSLLILHFELKRCKRRKTLTCTMFAAAFNFVFLHLWLIFSVAGVEHDVTDDRVALYIAISDLTWLSMLIFIRDSKNIMTPVKVNRVDINSTIIFFTITVIISVYYISLVGISIMAEDVEWARHTAKKGKGYYNIFITRGALLSAIFVYIFFRAGEIKKSVSTLVIAMVLLLQLATGFRTYIITTSLSLWLCHVNITRRYSFQRMLMAGMLVFIVFAIVTAYKYGISFRDTELSEIFRQVWPYIDHRIVMEMPRIINRILYLVDLKGLQFGVTYWWDITSAFPGPGYSFADILFLWMATNQEIAGIAPIPPGLIGESLMNFGVYGIPVGMGVAYFCMRKVDAIAGTGLLGLALKSVLTILIAEMIYLGMGSVLCSRFMPLMLFAFIFACIRYTIRLWNRSVLTLITKQQADTRRRKPFPYNP